jgi:Ca2+-binding EF-hand superfamily protein
MTDRRISFATGSSSQSSHPHRSSSAGRSSLPASSLSPSSASSVTAEDIKAAFAFFDPQQTGSITAQQLQQRLALLHPSLPASDSALLMLGKPAVTQQDIADLLTSSPPIPGFDPVQEAFRVFDPSNSGYVDPELLRSLLLGFGLTELTRADMSAVIDMTDRDRDGKVGLSDFRRMLQQQQSGKQS